MDEIVLSLACAQQVGLEVCWPATQVLAAIDALALDSSIILGAELWRLQADGAPEVLGWTEYKVDLGLPWQDSVRQAHRMAVDAVIGFEGDRDLWVNLTWLSTAQETSPKRVGEA